jgi:hypothetical protein
VITTSNMGGTGPAPKKKFPTFHLPQRFWARATRKILRPLRRSIVFFLLDGLDEMRLRIDFLERQPASDYQDVLRRLYDEVGALRTDLNSLTREVFGVKGSSFSGVPEELPSSSPDDLGN